MRDSVCFDREVEKIFGVSGVLIDGAIELYRNLQVVCHDFVVERVSLSKERKYLAE